MENTEKLYELANSDFLVPPCNSKFLRVGLYVFRPIFNRGFEHAAVVNAERNYDVQIAWVQNWGSKVTNLTTGNRVLFYTTFYLFAIFSELHYQKGFECGL